MRILYVEDNLTNVSLVKRVARQHEVISYIDGEEALKNFVRDNPDMVLMDIQLAGPLNGLQVIEKIRSDGYTLPIVAVTAYAMLGDRERCLAAGCDDYIAKPLPIPTLVEMIAKYSKVSAERRAEKPKSLDETQEMPVSKVDVVTEEPKPEIIPPSPAPIIVAESATKPDVVTDVVVEKEVTPKPDTQPESPKTEVSLVVNERDIAQSK